MVIGCGAPPSQSPPSKSPRTPPQPPSLVADVENYSLTGHSDRSGLQASRSVNDADDDDDNDGNSDDEDAGSYRKVADEDRGEDVKSDDTEVDTANMKADFRTLPFVRPSTHKRPPIVVAQYAAPASFRRPSPRPFHQVQSPHPIELSPSPPVMIPIVPTIIDI